VNDACLKVDGAYCRPGMRGCVIVGKVKFEDGKIPAPVWMPGREPGRPAARRDPASEPDPA
jgi:hypothetical protein